LTTGTLVHDALLYRDDGEYVDRIGEFITAGLDAGDARWSPSRGQSRTATGNGLGTRRRLRRHGDGGPEPVSDHSVHRTLSRAPRRQAGPFRRGADLELAEPRGDRRGCPARGAAQSRLRAGDVTILCPYDESGLDPEVIADAGRTHPTIRCAATFTGARTTPTRSTSTLRPTIRSDRRRWPRRDQAAAVRSRRTPQLAPGESPGRVARPHANLGLRARRRRGCDEHDRPRSRRGKR
jgi:hypothetical protein